ncbi:MAG: Fic family protein [Syntrophobacteraceae bacterium]
MDKSLFTDKAPGKLIKIRTQDGTDWAFIPDPLPREWKIPVDLWPHLMEAREELARLDGIGRHMVNYDLLLRPLQRREALKSSILEGTHVFPEQLLLFEIAPKEPKSADDQANSWREVSNYGKALLLGQQLLDQIPISIRLFKELHTELMSGVRGHERNPGNFRTSQVHIGSDRRFVPPPPTEAVNCLYELEKFIHEHSGIDALIFCFMVHYQFECIHPFSDGNGRVGRLLLSLMIHKRLNLTSPWLYLSAFFDKYKIEYIDKLFRISTHGDWYDWVLFCLRATIFQAKDSIKRFDELVLLRDSYMARVAGCGGSIRLHKIIEGLFSFPGTTIPRMAELCRISYPTAKNDIKILVENQILVPSGIETRPSFYLAPGIMKIAYEDPLE